MIAAARRFLLLAAGACLTMSVAIASDVDEAPLGEVVERHLSPDQPFMPWMQDPSR